MKWQPIETAPKDGTEVLLALWLFNDPTRGRVYEVGSYDADEELTIHPPTHWAKIDSPDADA